MLKLNTINQKIKLKFSFYIHTNFILYRAFLSTLAPILGFSSKVKSNRLLNLSSLFAPCSILLNLHSVIPRLLFSTLSLFVLVISYLRTFQISIIIYAIFGKSLIQILDTNDKFDTL